MTGNTELLSHFVHLPTSRSSPKRTARGFYSTSEESTTTSETTIEIFLTIKARLENLLM